MSALAGRSEPATLKNAVWGSDPELLTLWHGKVVPVGPGDRVRFYEPADGTLIFVAIDDSAATEELGDGAP